MSFMFKPYPYDDPTAINHIAVNPELRRTIADDSQGSMREILSGIRKKTADPSSCIIGIDGYISAPLEQFTAMISMECAQKGWTVRTLSASNLYLDSKVLQRKLLPYLPEDRELDPVLLYGSLYHEGYEGLMESGKIEEMKKEIRKFRNTKTDVLIVYGNGSLIDALRPFYDLKFYIDMTPKRTILNIRSGVCGNLGEPIRKAPSELLGRSYYGLYRSCRAKGTSDSKRCDRLLPARRPSGKSPPHSHSYPESFI